MVKNKTLVVQGISVSLYSHQEEDYICITDMIKAKDGEFFITDWLRNRNTLEFLGVWEQMYNPNFNYGEFAIIKSHAGLNSFKISVKEWVNRTNAIGITAKTGRYGGTYAHKDIAFEFGTWISPIFKLYIIKEYQRLKEVEANQYNLEWNVKRVLSKANYQIQTDAIKNHIVPVLAISKNTDWIYASEADMLNIIMFRSTAKQWREDNPERAKKGENIRDVASINDLAILSNLETQNATLIKQNIAKEERFEILSQIAEEQRRLLGRYDYVKSIKKTSERALIDAADSTFNQSLKKALNYDPKEEEGD